jgi:hypothetical protein
MGFGACINIDINFDGATGRPYVYKNGEKCFDMTQVPTIPDEFKEFIKLSGWEWCAYMPSYMDGEEDWTITTDIPSYQEVCEYEHMSVDGNDPYHSEELYNKFKSFLKWVEATGLNYYYTTWA